MKQHSSSRRWLVIEIVLAGLVGLYFLLTRREGDNGGGLPLVLAWAGHGVITRRAIALLPEKVRRWLGEEVRMLSEVYCMFPDLNWPWKGTWGGDGATGTAYVDDRRREWNVSYYCGWDPIALKAPPAPLTTTSISRYPSVSRFPEWAEKDARYWPMGAFEAPRVYFPKIVMAIQEGKTPDGMRFLGTLLHHVQDRGAFTHWLDVHKNNRIEDGSALGDLPDYEPRVLGETVDEAVAAIRARMWQTTEAQAAVVEEYREAIRTDDKPVRAAMVKQAADLYQRLSQDTQRNGKEPPAGDLLSCRLRGARRTGIGVCERHGGVGTRGVAGAHTRQRAQGEACLLLEREHRRRMV